jgi:hypothetical protein
MNEATYKQLKKKIVEVNAVITKLDPAIKTDAFSLLKPYLREGQTLHADNKDEHTNQLGTVHGDAGTLISTHPDGSPADNVSLVAAYLYSQYGSTTFSPADIKELGDSFGLTVPNRIDNTLKAAKRGGKRLFQKVGKQFKVTVTGEAHFKTEYRVTKGSKSRSAEVES